MNSRQSRSPYPDAYADRTFNVVESSSVDPTMGAKFFQKCLVCSSRS